MHLFTFPHHREISDLHICQLRRKIIKVVFYKISIFDMAQKRTELENPYTACDDWAFHIPLPAFFSALDIQKTKRTRLKKDQNGQKIINPITKEPERKVWYVWTQSNPPKWNFAEGDTFHSPAALAEGPWPSNPTGTSIQIQSIKGDVIMAKKIEWPSQSSTILHLTQDSIAALLRGENHGS